MRRVLILIFVLLLAACQQAAKPAMPTGVVCDQNSSPIGSVPPKADPSSSSYSDTYAMGWYLAHGCDVSGMGPPSPPAN